MAIQTLTLNVNAQPSAEDRAFLYLSQNENGRDIRFRILGDDLPSGCTATLSGVKPDGNVWSKAGTVTNNFVVVEEDIQMTAVAGRWDAQLDIVNGSKNIVTALIRITVEAAAVEAGAIPSDTQLEGYVEQCKQYAETAKNEAYGSPLTAATAAAMTDQSRVYVYTGSETGYTAGHWYYHNGSAWTDGGVYNAVAVDTDTTLSVSGKAADAKKTGDELNTIKEDLQDYVLSKYTTANPTNWLNLDAVTTGYKIKANGTSESSANSCYTDYIPVTEGNKVAIYRKNSQVFTKLYRSNICLYDSDKNVVSGGSDSGASADFIIPSGVSFVRISMTTSNLLASIYAMITLDGVTPTAYSEYFEPYEVLSENFLTEASEQVVDELTSGDMARSRLSNRYACSIPRRTLRMTIELEHPWYINSLITPSMAHIGVGLGGSDKYKRYDDKIDIIGNTAVVGVNGYRFWMYDEVFGAKLMSDVTYAPAGYGLGGQWANLNLSDCSLLAIGDSTVDQGDTMTNALLSIFAQNNHTITLLGTLGSGSNKNEGRAGWSAKDYLTNKQYGGVVNPFYNPTSGTFDFSYYMTEQGYSAPDFVVLQLGINDLYNLKFDEIPNGIITTWNAIKTMVDSILAYNASIKIILNLPTAPNSDISLHTNFLPLYQNSVIRYNDYAQEQALLYSESKVRVSYCHLILNPETDIRDTVHPNTDGYTKMAEEVVSQINCWQNG